MKTKVGVLVLAAAMMAVGSYADSFGAGANQFSIDFVDIGYAGNTADTSGYGAVGYNYRIGTYEVTIDQFAKARAADSRVGSGDEGYWNAVTGAPASRTSWLEGAKFANWLTTGDAYNGVYQFDGSGTLTGVNRSFRNGNDMAYVLPTEDEWYKAAYYKPVNDGSYSLYASGDSLPTAGAGGENYNNAIGRPWSVGTGIAENNGTYDMNGNVREWNESAYDGTLDNMVAETLVIRGGSAFHSGDDLRSSSRYGNGPTAESYNLGFRVAAIPEPSSAILIAVISGFGLFVRRRFPSV